MSSLKSFYGADYYGQPRNTDTIALRLEAWQVPDSVGFGEQRLVPLCAGETINWKMAA